MRLCSCVVEWQLFCGVFLAIVLLLHNCVSVPCSGLQVNVCVDFE